MTNEIRSKIHSALNYFELRRHINEVNSFIPFNFSLAPGDEEIKLGSGRISTLVELEPELENCFILNLESEEQQYSILKYLQRLRFDIFNAISMPKGEKYSITHDNIPELNEYLIGENLPNARHFETLRGKIISRSIQNHGRLHVRFYKQPDSTNLIATAHIDLPDINHLRIGKHFSRQVKVDYAKGTELFGEIIEYLNQFQASNLELE